MGGGRKKRHGIPIGPLVRRDHKEPGIINPEVREKIYGLDPSRLRAKPISGGKKDARRVRLVKDFYSRLQDEQIVFVDLTDEVEFSTVPLGRRFPILSFNVPSNRTLIIDNMYFFARAAFGLGELLPPGVIEGSVQCFFEIGEVVPVEIRSSRVQTLLPSEDRAYFPFLGDRVGAREVEFSLYAKSGREVEAYYINRAVSPVPIGTVGFRVEGWLIDSNIIEEILEQQR